MARSAASWRARSSGMRSRSIAAMSDELLPALNAILPDLDGSDSAWVQTMYAVPARNDGRAGLVFDGEDCANEEELVLTVGNDMMGDDAAGPCWRG